MEGDERMRDFSREELIRIRDRAKAEYKQWTEEE